MNDSTSSTRYAQAEIEADPSVPIIHIRRDFAATPAQLLRAHTDPELFAQWIGPEAMTTRIDYWDARTGGSWRYLSYSNGQDHAFRGTFHTVDENRIVQTFTWEGLPDDVSLETMTFDDLGDGTTRMHITSLCESFDARDGWLSSGMESGVNEGYAKIDALLAAGAL
jgi:uncharacterized protein YndB with AHSA1/START domain